MKKTRLAIVFCMILLFLLLPFGCKKAVVSDNFDLDDTGTASLSPTDALFPPFSGETSEEGTAPTEESIAEKAPDPPPRETEGETSAVSPEPTLSEYDTYTAACAKENVNVRSGAGTDHPILTTLKKGDSLPFLERVGDWVKVRTQSGVGYLFGRYVYYAETSAYVEKVIRAGLQKLGTPYLWGAPRILNDKGEVSPYFTGKSFDCSSFVQYCFFVGCGVKLGNYTGSQADHTVGKTIYDYTDLKRGDFYFTGNGSISHVVIYLGGNLLLQTYSANGGPVSVTTDERWRCKFLSGRRPDPSVIEQFR